MRSRSSKTGTTRNAHMTLRLATGRTAGSPLSAQYADRLATRVGKPGGLAVSILRSSHRHTACHPPCLLYPAIPREDKDAKWYLHRPMRREGERLKRRTMGEGINHDGTIMPRREGKGRRSGRQQSEQAA